MSADAPTDGSHYDVLVVGGGPAGCATAAALTARSVRTLLIDRGDAQRGPAVESLPPSVREALTGLGLWDAFQSSQPINSPGIVSAWGTPEPNETDFLFQPGGSGWHVERSSYRVALTRCLRTSGTTVLPRCRLLQVDQRPNENWSVILRDGSDSNSPRRLTVRAAMLVDATGYSSALATRLGARRVRHDCLVAVVNCVPMLARDALADQRLWLEATNEGWWYTAPWRGGIFAAYLTDVDLVPRRRGEWQAWWKAAWTRTTTMQSRARTNFDSPVRLLSAATSRLDRFTGRNWLAVGDAACTLDPLAGHGVQSALTTGTEAASAIIDVLHSNTDRMSDYAAVCEHRFTAALHARAGYYSQPMPWSNAPFWKRRAQAPDQKAG